MKRINVIKVGGKVVEEPSTLAALLDRVTALDTPVVMVHGGGRSATALATRLGMETVMVAGRRVTDRDMLQVVTMVYAGRVNKEIVAQLQARGVNAIGLTGADMNLIVSTRRPSVPVDYGFVGDPCKTNAGALSLLLDNGYMPVVAPLTHDGNGCMLNTNADTISQTVAVALARAGHSVTLTYCFEKPGVLANPDDDTSVIGSIDPATYRQLKTDGSVGGGMIPKLDNAFAALDSGVESVVITSAENLKGGTVVRL